MRIIFPIFVFLLFSVSCSAEITPEQWGAVGDGYNDDTVAIQQAIDAVPENGMVSFKDGSIYRITNTIFLKPYMTLDLSGSSILVDSGFSGTAFEVNANDKLQANVNIIGGRIIEDEAPGRNWTAIKFTSNKYGIAFCTVRDTRIDDAGKGIVLQIDHTGGAPFINSNYFENITMMGITTMVDFVGTGDYTQKINRNTFINVTGQSGTAEYGFKNIFGVSNTFIACMVWDFGKAPDHVYSMEISPLAENTLVLGGEPFEYGIDNGINTTAHVRSFSKLFYKRLSNVHYQFTDIPGLSPTFGSDVIIEGVTHPVLEFLSDLNRSTGIKFTNSDAIFDGGFNYNNTSKNLIVRAGNATRVSIDGLNNRMVLGNNTSFNVGGLQGRDFRNLQYGNMCAADGDIISHGMTNAPAIVVATGSVAGESVQVTHIGAETFTVAIKNNGSPGTPQNINWIAIRN